jgi:hypothetical protein
MTPAELRIACAEKCGWKVESKDTRIKNVYYVKLIEPFLGIVGSINCYIDDLDKTIEFLKMKNYPDYEHDRNALHELILNVPKDKRSKFVIILGKITLNRDLPAIISMYVYDLLIADPIAIMRAFLTVMEDNK